VDLWNCPCRECTDLEYQVSDTDLNLDEFRADQWPEVWGQS
jgi:hypothetical protein